MSQKPTMQEVQRQILELISASNGVSIEDETIAEKLKIELEEARFYLEELRAGKFIELYVSKAFDAETHLATSVTPRGYMVLRGKLKLDDRADSKLNSKVFNITNHSPIGAQQFGDQNIANVTQYNHSDLTEILQLVDTLKQLIETLPSNDREVAKESVSLIEEEIIAPTARRLAIVTTGLFALWSVVKNIVTVANATTALAERFGIHLPG